MFRKLKGSLLISVMVCLLVTGIAGCGTEEAEDKPVAQDLQNYLEYFQQISEREQAIVSSFESITGDNYTDDETMHKELVENTLPETEALLDYLREMEFTTPEIQQLHESYLEGWENQKEGFQHYVEAVEKDDPEITETGNQYLEEGTQQMDQVIQELNQLAEEHNVTRE